MALAKQSARCTLRAVQLAASSPISGTLSVRAMVLITETKNHPFDYGGGLCPPPRALGGGGNALERAQFNSILDDPDLDLAAPHLSLFVPKYRRFTPIELEGAIG